MWPLETKGLRMNSAGERARVRRQFAAASLRSTCRGPPSIPYHPGKADGEPHDDGRDEGENSGRSTGVRKVVAVDKDEGWQQEEGSLCFVVETE